MIQSESAVASITRNGHIYFGKKMVADYGLRDVFEVLLVYGHDYPAGEKGIYCIFFFQNIVLFILVKDIVLWTWVAENL